MPRPAKPYLHRGWWVTNLGGSRQKLCPECDGASAAREAFDALRQEQKNNGASTFRKLRVVELIALFLDTVKVEKSQSTYSDYQRWLTEFAKLHGNRLVREITRLDAQNFKNDVARRTYTSGKAAGKPYKPKTVNHAIIALKRCWNWGIETELLPPKNPISKLALLHAEGRQRIVTNEEFQALLRNNSDALFRQFLLMLRYTSSRPGEIRKLTWTMVDWPNHRLVIHRHKTSRTQKTPKPRIIPIPPCIEALLRWLQKKHGHQPYCFLNSKGEPWTKDATVHAAGESMQFNASSPAGNYGDDPKFKRNGWNHQPARSEAIVWGGWSGVAAH